MCEFYERFDWLSCIIKGFFLNLIMKNWAGTSYSVSQLGGVKLQSM